MSEQWLAGLLPDGDGVPRAPASSPAAIADATRALGPGPVAWAVQAAAGATAKIARQVPEVAAGPAGPSIAQRSAEACLLAILVGLLDDTPPDRFQTPDTAIEGNRELVHRGVPLDRILRAVWTAHAHAYGLLLGALRQHADPGRWAAESDRVTDLSFAYVDVMTAAFAADYAAERESWIGELSAARRHLIDEILAGRPVDRAAAGRTLGLELGHHHVAIIAWSDPAPEQAGDLGQAAHVTLRRLVAELARASGAAHSLVMPTGTAEVWAWLSWPREPAADLAELARKDISAISEPDGSPCVALGQVMPGVAGLRVSHLAAREARRIGQAIGGAGVWAYGDVAVLALLTADPAQAERYMRQTLGGLGGGDPRLAEIRETLRLYLSYGRSRAQAAERLFVAPNTVAYRVRRAEELLGKSIPEDHLALRLALEIARIIAP
jgi:hypothetical protein